MGKGSSRRPTDTRSFETNYDTIFGQKKPIYDRKEESK